MTDYDKISESNTASNRPMTIENEEYEIRDSDPLFDDLDSVVERSHNRRSRPVWFKYKPVHNLQSTPKDKFLIKAVKTGIRKFQFVGHWAIQIGNSWKTQKNTAYIWELWQDPTTHQIRLGEQHRGPVEWTNLRVIKTSTGEVVETKETLKGLHWWHKCGNTTMTDLEIRDKAMDVISNLSKEKLGRLDRLMRWRTKIELKAIDLVFSSKAERRLSSILGFYGKIQSGVFHKIRGNTSDAEWQYDVFFRNCHIFAERLASEICTSKLRTKLFFLPRANARKVLYSHFTQDAMPQSLQQALSSNQQTNMLFQMQ